MLKTTATPTSAKPQRALLPIGAREHFELCRGDAANSRIWLDVLVHHGTGLDHRAGADLHTGQDHTTRAQPSAVADADRIEDDRSSAMLREVELVCAGQDQDARLDSDALTNRQLLGQVEHAVGVDTGLVADQQALEQAT